MVSESKLRTDWHRMVVSGGVFFDRIRLLEFIPPHNYNSKVENLYIRIREWLSGALDYLAVS